MPSRAARLRGPDVHGPGADHRPGIRADRQARPRRPRPHVRGSIRAGPAARISPGPDNGDHRRDRADHARHRPDHRPGKPVHAATLRTLTPELHQDAGDPSSYTGVAPRWWVIYCEPEWPTQRYAIRANWLSGTGDLN